MVRARKSKVDTLAQQMKGLAVEELEDLHRRILDLLAGREPDGALHNIMELEGLGKEFWRSIDVDEYLRKERDSWR